MAYAAFAVSYTPEPVRCSGGPKPGAIVLQDWACDESPWARYLFDVGIYVCRTIAGTSTLSAHSSGRAGDSAHTIVDNASHPAGIAYADWLVANHAILGVQEVICNRRRWDNQSKQWRSYGGVSPHTDHVHWTLNQSGALYLTRARVLSVAPQTQPQSAPPIAPPEDDDMRVIVKGDGKGVTDAVAARWYITDGITARHIDDRAEAGVLVFSKCATWDDGEAFVWPQAVVNDLHKI